MNINCFLSAKWIRFSEDETCICAEPRLCFLSHLLWISSYRKVSFLFLVRCSPLTGGYDSALLQQYIYGYELKMEDCYHAHYSVCLFNYATLGSWSLYKKTKTNTFSFILFLVNTKPLIFDYVFSCLFIYLF